MTPSSSRNNHAPDNAGSSPPSPLKPALYLVATPIGNAGDLSFRARAVLESAGRIACEDTRVTGRLLSMLGVKGRLMSYHDHSTETDRDRIIERINSGESVALVSDAGTPLISDPGYKLVRACAAAGVAVTAVPGPSSVLAALTLSALPSDRFFSYGFLPQKQGARRRALESVAAVPGTLIFLESVKRLAVSLGDMADVLGDRGAAVAREITKLHEEVRRGTLLEIAARYREEGAPKGEAVVVVGPPPEKAPQSGKTVDARLRAALAAMSVKDAAAAVAEITGLPRKTLYQRALELNRGGDG